MASQARFINAYFPAPAKVGETVYIGAVNGRRADNAVPPSCEVGQASVFIAGANFGVDIGLVTYSGFEIGVSSWTDTLIEVSWPTIPFDGNYSDVQLDVFSEEGENNHIPGTQKTLRVTDTSGAYAVELVSTTPAVNSTDYAVITSIPGGSIYTGNPDIEVGVDYGYIRVTGGTADTIDAATGVLTDLSPGATVQYSIYDPTSNEWRVG